MIPDLPRAEKGEMLMRMKLPPRAPWLFVLAFLFATTSPTISRAAALEAVQPLLGEYVFSGEMSLAQARRLEIVPDGLNSPGNARIRALQAEGYICQHVYRGQFKCVQFLHGAELPTEARARLENTYRDSLRVRFDAPAGTPTLVNQAPDLEEWEVAQTGVAAGRAFDRYLFQFLISREAPTVRKVALATSQQYTEWRFRLLESNDLAFWVETSIGDAFRWTAYSVEMILRRQPAAQ